MFAAIAGGLAVGFVLGSIYGKYVVSEAAAIKTHVSAEIAALEARIKTRL